MNKRTHSPIARWFHAPICLLRGNADGATVTKAIFAMLAGGLMVSALAFVAVKVWAACDYGSPAPTLPYVCTDADDYLPGTTAKISGVGFQAGETVQLQVLHADGTPATGKDHEPWDVVADSNGALVTTWHVCKDDCVGST